MPILIPKGHNKYVIDDLWRLARQYIFPTATQHNIGLIAKHLRWMERQNDQLIVYCRFETSEDKRRTRMVFDATFKEQIKDATVPTEIDATVFKSH